MQIDKDQKQVYVSAEMEIIAVDSADIICTSGIGGGSNEGYDFDDI